MATENSGNRRRQRKSVEAREREWSTREEGTVVSREDATRGGHAGAAAGSLCRGARKEASFPHRDSAPSLAPIPC